MLTLLLSNILSVNACDVTLKQWLRITFLCPSNYYNNNNWSSPSCVCVYHITYSALQTRDFLSIQYHKIYVCNTEIDNAIDCGNCYV